MKFWNLLTVKCPLENYSKLMEFLSPIRQPEGSFGNKKLYIKIIYLAANDNDIVRKAKTILIFQEKKTIFQYVLFNFFSFYTRSVCCWNKRFKAT